ncbi:unnamed protein product, partial [Laminaria digitata]
MASSNGEGCPCSVESGCQHPNLPSSGDCCSACDAPLHPRCSPPPVDGRFYCGSGSGEGALRCQFKDTWNAAWRTCLMDPHERTGNAKSTRLDVVYDDSDDSDGAMGTSQSAGEATT